MQQLDLNLLAALDALLQEGSVVGAAARLGITASAMSRALARIRAQTGDPMMVRAGRGLVPTPRALDIRDRVRAATSEAHALLSKDVRNDPSSFARTFSIRADDAVTAVLGPQLLDVIGRHAPGVNLVFCTEGEEDVAALREGGVDLDIGVQGSLGPEIRTRKLVDDHRVVLVRGAHSRRRRLTLSSYAKAEHVDVSRRGLMRGPVDDVLQAHGLSRTVRAVVPNQLAAAVLVAQSDLLSLVSARFAISIGSLLDVRALKPPIELARVSIALAWHPRHDGDPVHAWIRHQLLRIADAIRSA